MITVMRVCFFVVSISVMASLVATSLANNSLAKPTEASLSLHQVDQPSSSPCSTFGDPPDGRPDIESSFSDDSAPLIPNDPSSSTTTTLSTTPSAGTSSGRHNSQSSSSLCPSNSHTSLSLPLESPISSSSTSFHANSNSISISISNSNSNSNSMQPQNILMHDQAPQRSSVTTNQPIPSDHHVIDMEQLANNKPASADLTDNNNRPVMLGKTFLGLTFQAALGLMVFRFQGPPSSSSSSSSSSNNVHERTLEIVEAAMAVGFTGTLIGILLRHAYPLEARYIEYAGAFAASFGFLGITTMFLPDNVNWIVWPAGLLLLAAFILALFKMRGAGSM